MSEHGRCVGSILCKCNNFSRKSGIKRSGPICADGADTKYCLSRIFIERLGIARPGTVHIRTAVLPRARASPSATANGPAVRCFTHVNLLALIPAANSLSSAVPVPAFSHLSAAVPVPVFSHLSAASLRHAFAPFSAAGPGLASAGTSFGSIFWAEIVPGNTRACVRLSPGPAPHSTFQHVP